MFKSLIFFVRFFLFWLLFFAIDRFLFIFIFHKKLRSIALSEKLASFYHALRLDLSITAYLAVVPLFIFLFWFWKNNKTVNFNWLSIYNTTFIVIFSLISVINFNIYREWGSKINEKVFSFVINTPNEALASSASSPLILTVLICMLLVVTGIYLNHQTIKKRIQFYNGPFWQKMVITVLILVLNFLCIRGGLGVAPNNQSMAYFSRYQILNHAALNTEWNLISTLLTASKTNENPYLFMDQKHADESVFNLYKVENDSSIAILTTKKPNIVLFILESFTADLTKTLGNEQGITPNFDRLTTEGILFTNIYAAGNRTDKGLIATLTGFPTLGIGSIVNWPEKMQKLPAISQKLLQNGYQTSFYYGGESEFDNYKAFILSHDYQRLVDKNSFEKKDMNSKWGAYDEVVFNKQITEIKQAKQPFFSTILSLTNHEPFELQGNYKFGDENNINKFKSTAYYTDSCINAYLTAAKKQEWYKNTLFIFVADHGHIYPKNKYDIFEPERYQIPLLFYGEVIKKEYRGKNIDFTGSQQDIAATLLAQLHIPSKDFIWSKNLLNPNTKHFAFFTWDDGLGFVNDKHCVTFENVGKTILHNNQPDKHKESNNILTLGKSYLQSVYQQFIKL